VSQEKSKMPVSRQIRYLRRTRENWKQNAAEKQGKIREYEQIIRSLKISRDNWKTRAKESEEKVKQLENKLEKQERKKSKIPESSPSEILRDNLEQVKNHHYNVQTIQVSIQQILEAGNSYRGVATTMKIFSQSFKIESPHYSTIRQWLGRIGLYELKREKEKREDWIYIIDLTLELGKEKALVIYGISEEIWQANILKEERGLKHTDGEILAIEVTESATGEWIQEILEKLTIKLGTPCQIVSDNGSNLKKAIKLYQENHQEVIHTYDVTHAMANLLKKELVPSQIFQDFLTDCHQCKQELKQTELAFLAPPSQRSQCRYFNAERLVNWATNLLNCPLTIFDKLLPLIDTEQLDQRLKEKLMWLNKYQEQIPLWSMMIRMTRTLEKQLKLLGLNQQSLTTFSSSLATLVIPESLESFKQKIFNYLHTEMNFIKDDRTILATSDVLESIFGKYKRFSEQCPLQDLRSMLLTIPLATMNLTKNVIKKALETVRGIDLSQWVNDVFGESMLSKRKSIFSSSNSDMKTV
jgi:hypothetical protein